MPHPIFSCCFRAGRLNLKLLEIMSAQRAKRVILICKNSKKNCSSRLFFYFLFGYYALVYSNKSLALPVDTFSNNALVYTAITHLKYKKPLVLIGLL
jgi:hypothetical protein